jgi:HK97 family phage major capsid protein
MDDQVISIKEIRQERAELLAEQAQRKSAARATLSASDLPEDERDDVLAGHDDRIDTINHRLAVLAKRESQWDTYKADAIAEQPAREGSDIPTGASKPPTPFVSLGEQLQSVAAYTRDPYSRHAGVGKLQQIQAATGAGEDVASDGGFLVQTDFTSELLRLVHETGVLAGLTDRKPISGNANGLKINAVDETSRVDGSRWGGVRAYWAAEAGSLTASKPTYRQMELSLQKLTGLYYATDELLGDTVALGAFVQDAFAEEFGFKVDDAIIRGSGAGQPLGILGHAGTVSVAKETGQSATTLLAENVEKMYARLWPPSLRNARWLINQDVWRQIFQLSHVVGTGGVPLFILPGAIPEAPSGQLLGIPVVPIEQCETLGTVGDIILADLSQYLMIEKGGIDAASSIHVQFLTDETTFRFILRTDGQPKRNAALTPYKGSNTQSSFVTLATRA